MASGFSLGHSARQSRNPATSGLNASTSSFRALVAESSYSELKLFCARFLDAATTRSMTGWVRSMTGGGSRFLDAATTRSMTGWVRSMTGAALVFWMLRLRAA